MNKKGFTLIELLTVLIILAIISLIIVPNSLKVINNSKKSATSDSEKIYIKAVKNKLYEYELKGFVIEDGTYNILSNGNLCLEQNGSTCLNELDLELDGTKPIRGTITIETLENLEREITGDVIYE